MKDVFSKAGRAALEEFAASNVLLGLDYDGTLAPIVHDPARAIVPARTRTLLRQVARRYPCAIVSGRPRREVLRFLRGVPVLAVVGNHGLETEARPPAALLPAIRGWRAELAAVCARLDGVRIEDKRWSLSVHYRGARQKARVEDTLLCAARALPGARVVRGKDVVSVVHGRAPHKGTALLELRRRFNCDTAIYVGDDETDEDVFALRHPSRLLAVRVGRSRQSLAPFVLRSQPRIDAFLSLLLSLRL